MWVTSMKRIFVFTQHTQATTTTLVETHWYEMIWNGILCIACHHIYFFFFFHFIFFYFFFTLFCFFSAEIFHIQKKFIFSHLRCYEVNKCIKTLGNKLKHFLFILLYDEMMYTKSKCHSFIWFFSQNFQIKICFFALKVKINESLFPLRVKRLTNKWVCSTCNFPFFTTHVIAISD